MKPQIIHKDGEPVYAVIPYAQFEKLLADAEMLADIVANDAAKSAIVSGAEEVIPAAVVDRLMDGENPVKVWREYRSRSAADLAKACGVSAAAISQVEGDKRQASLQLLQKIAKVLSVDLDDLVRPGSDSREGGAEGE